MIPNGQAEYVPFRGLLNRGIDPSVVEELRELTHNVRSLRSQFWQALTDARRSVNDECGFPPAPVSPQVYWDLFDRDPVANRVVSVMAKECWQVTPTVTEDDDPDERTAFEMAWDELGAMTEALPSWYGDEKGSLIWEYLIRADVLSGIGQYGVIVLGLDDGLDPSLPAPGWDEVYSEPEVSPAYGKAVAAVAAARGTKPESPDPDPLGAAFVERMRGVRNLAVNARSSGLPARWELRINAAKTKGRRLISIHTLPQVLAKVTAYEVNRSSPRFGQPVIYQITFNDPREMNGEYGPPTGTQMYHWSRVVHVADNRVGNNMYGVERLRPVLNNVLSAQKPTYASAEGFWKACFTLLSLETADPETDVDAASLKNMMEEVQNGLQKFFWLKGLSAKSIAPTVVDPTPFVLTQIQQICIQLGIPQRVFMGSERGELASSQDDAAWNDRLKHRQQTYLTPWVIRPFVDRLIALGVLPEPEKYSITWPEVASNNPTEKSQILLTRTQAMGAYSSSGANAVMGAKDYLTREMGFDEEEAENILENVREEAEDAAEAQTALEVEQAQTRYETGLGGPVAEEERTQAGFDAEQERADEELKLKAKPPVPKGK